MKSSPRLRFTPLLACIAFGILILAPPGHSQPNDCKAPDPVQHDLENSTHVPNCSFLNFTHYPPTSGHHYDALANYRTFHFVVNPGYYIHSAQHGAVVFLINCHTTGDCEGDIARLQRIADDFPVDPICSVELKHRIVIAGDTLLPKRFAAIAWGWSEVSDCLDSTAFAAFLTAHYNHASEDRCDLGTDFVGAGWCNAPLALQPGKEAMVPGAPTGKGILWIGSLARRGRMEVEVADLKGALIQRYDLGAAGPGPAQAIWDPDAFRKAFPTAGVVACRVKLTSASGPVLLREAIAYP